MARDRTKIERQFIWSLLLICLILVLEVVGGILTGSLALLSDAAHVFLDAMALGISFVAIRLSARPPDARYTFGLHRLQVLAALANGTTLIVVAVGIFREAWERFQAPPDVVAGPMLIVALIGLAVNLVVALVLGDHDHNDLNVRSAFLHVLGDALASVGVVIAGAVILLTGWTLIDPIVSVLIGVIITLGSLRVLREALHILTEGVPRNMDIGHVRDTMQQAQGVCDVHDLHIWTVSPGFLALSAHVVLEDQPLARVQSTVAELKHVLAHEYGISHVTIQVESQHCGEAEWALPQPSHHHAH